MAQARLKDFMNRTRRVMGLWLLVLAVALPAFATRTNSLYEKGKDAEARQNYEQAYQYYKQAYDQAPKDVRYRTAYERTKFLAAALHVHQGQLLRDAGKLQEALQEFQKAFAIDPSSFITQQEIKRTQELISRAKAPPAPPVEDIFKKRLEQSRGPAELKPVSDQPIVMHMSADVKTIYTTIGKLAGINVLFDPDLASGPSARKINVDLNNVTLFQALEFVGLESKTFWRPVTSNTVFVATDTKSKRQEMEQSVIKTFYLQNLAQQTEIQDVTNTLRQILDIQKLTPLTTENAIIIRGTPDQIALAEKLISDLDKPRPEVVVEVAVMQVRRDKIRELGISPPTSGSIQLENTGTTTTTTSNGTTSTTTSNTGGGGSFNLNQLGNLTANNFSVSFPGATLSFLFSDGNTKIIQNPEIRAMDGQKASLKIGDRIPIATGSFQPGIGGVGINPLVNTQFSYQDVGVNIDLTPTVHTNGDITLKVSIDISSVTGQSSIGGITQPIIGQRRIDHTIQLKEGEINLMGGILENTDIKSLSGYPWLSQVPLLRYLFSQEHTEHHENEVVFALIPHIVRETEISDMNMRAIDVGTSNNIELRYNGSHDAPATPNTASGAPATSASHAPVMAPAATTPATNPPVANPPAAQPMSAPAGPQPIAMATPPVQPQPSQPAYPATMPQGGALLSFDPPQLNQTVGSTFAVNVVLNGATNLYSVPAQIAYDPKVLQLVNISNGGLLSRDGQPVALVSRSDPPGTIQVTAARPPNSGGASGEGPVFTLTFMAKAAGQSMISTTQVNARNASMQPVPVNPAQAMVTVR